MYGPQFSVGEPWISRASRMRSTLRPMADHKTKQLSKNIETANFLWVRIVSFGPRTYDGHGKCGERVVASRRPNKVVVGFEETVVKHLLAKCTRAYCTQVDHVLCRHQKSALRGFLSFVWNEQQYRGVPNDTSRCAPPRSLLPIAHACLISKNMWSALIV